LVVNNTGVNDDGLVAAPVINSTSGCNWGTGTGQCYYSYPRQTYLTQNVMDSQKFSYDLIKNEYWGKHGLGTTMTGNVTLSQVVTATGGTGVAFVSGNLNITTNNTVAVDKFFMVVVNGDISIDQAATSVQGIFLTNGTVDIGGQNDTPLTLSGMIYALEDISVTRSFSTKSNNNSAPAAMFIFRPDFIFSTPPLLMQSMSLRY